MEKKNHQTEIISELEKQLEVKIVNIKTPLQGMDSEVFFAIGENGKEYVIKYFSRGSDGDAPAYKLLEKNKVDVPAPKVLGSFMVRGRPVLVLEKINFPLLETVAVGKMHRYIRSMIQNLRKIHKIRSGRAGSLDVSGKNRSWKEIMLAKFDGKDPFLNWKEIAKRDELDQSLVLSSVENMIKRIDKAEFAEGNYSFLHTDFNQRNLFVDDDSNEISGIIDWGEAMFGDPIYDFARVRMLIWHFNLGGSALADYDALTSFSNRQKRMEEIYILSRIIEYLAYYSQERSEFNVGRIRLHQGFLRSYNWQ